MQIIGRHTPAIFGNSEAFSKLRGEASAALGGRYGLMALGDVGRVFVAGESSSRWHTAAGGGIWLAVFASAWSFQVASSMNAMIARSDERTAFYFTTGFGL